MVVIDEAHNLRNPSTQRALALRRLLAGSPSKDLVLITATPVNNSLWDLCYLLGYFVKNDAAFADVGIRSLQDHIAAAMAMNPDDLSPEYLFDVLDAVAVRRTRPFVKRYYPNDTLNVGGRQVPITFPTPRVTKVSYNLDDVLPGFFSRFEHALDSPVTGGSVTSPDVLTLGRYAPSRYRLDGSADAYEVQLAGLLRSGLLKRFESSAYAFACTCRHMASTHDAFLSLLDRGKSRPEQLWRTGSRRTPTTSTSTTPTSTSTTPTSTGTMTTSTTRQSMTCRSYRPTCVTTVTCSSPSPSRPARYAVRTTRNWRPSSSSSLRSPSKPEPRGSGAMTLGTSARCWCSAISPTRLSGSPSTWRKPSR